MIKMVNGIHCFLDNRLYENGEIVWYCLKDDEYYSKNDSGKYYIKELA